MKHVRKGRWYRVAKRLAWFAAALFLFHLVAMNVALRTRLFRSAFNGSPEKLYLEYTSAYSVIPGRVHVEGFTLRGRDGSVEWILGVDRCDFTLAFHDLFRRRLHATHVRADGLAFRVRLRLDTVEATPERIAAQPPIPGFADPPYKDTGPPPAPITDAQYRLWSVLLEDVDVTHVRETWIDALRTAGDMHVRGRWLFRPLRWLDVGPATVDAHDLEVTYGKAVIATGLVGTIGATVDPFDLREVTGTEILRHVSVDLALRGISPTSSAIEAFVRRRGVHVTRAGGPVDGHLVVEHGRVRPGTLVRAEPAPVELDVSGVRGSATVGSALHVDAATEGRVVTSLDVTVAGIAVDAPMDGHVRAAAIDVAIRAGEIDLTRLTEIDLAGSSVVARDAAVRGLGFDARAPTIAVRLPRGRISGGAIDDARVDVEIGEVDVLDLRAAARFIPASAGVTDLEGIATASAQASLLMPARTLSGRASVHTPRVAARVAGFPVASAVDATLALARGSWDDDDWEIAPSVVTLRALAVKTKRGLSMLDVPSATLRTSRLAIDRHGQKGTIAALVPRAVVPDATRVAALVTWPKGTSVDAGFVVASGDADFELASRAVKGHAHLDASGLAVRLGARTVTGDVRAFVSAKHAPRGVARAIDLAGTSVDITNLRTSRTDSANDGWWGHFHLPAARLTLRPKVSLVALVYGRARDAQPADAIVAANTAIPDWVAGVFRMPDLRVESELRATPTTFGIHSFVARGSQTRIRLEYEEHADDANGAVIVELGELNVGFELTRDGSSVVLLDAQSWFVKRADALARASVNR